MPWENSLAVLELLSLLCSSDFPRGTLSTCLIDTHILGIGHFMLYPLDTVPTNLTSINLTLSQILTQAQETILVLSKQLQALQVHTKSKKPSTKRTALDQKTKDSKSKCYCWTHGRTRRLDHTSTTCNFPKTGHQVGATFGDKMGGSEKWCEEDKARE